VTPPKKSKSKAKASTSAEEILRDPFKVRIEQEVEEFLKDLTLEFPFSEIFEILRRYEFKDRFGPKVTPFPKKGLSPESLKEIDDRIQNFFGEMKKNFGSKYAEFIADSFKYYTGTTVE